MFFEPIHKCIAHIHHCCNTDVAGEVDLKGKHLASVTYAGIFVTLTIFMEFSSLVLACNAIQILGNVILYIATGLFLIDFRTCSTLKLMYMYGL